MRTYKKKDFLDENDPMQEIYQLAVQEKVIEFIDKFGLPAGLKEKHLNLIYGFISTVNHAHWKNFSGDADAGRKSYVRVSSTALRGLLGNRYKAIRDFLVDIGVVELGKPHVIGVNGKGGRCQEFRIRPDLASGNFASIPVFGPNKLPMELEALAQEELERDWGHPSYNLIRDNTHKLKIDSPLGLRYLLRYGLEEPKTESAIQRQEQIIRVLGDSYRPFKPSELSRANCTVDYLGRFYSEFTGLFREGRGSLRLNGGKLKGVDIHASHWFHALMMWPEADSKEGDLLLQKLTEEDFYEFLAEVVGGNSRDEVKIPSLKILHSHPKRMSKETKVYLEALQAVIPSFCNWLHCQKDGDSRMNSHKPFSNRLMKEESKRVVLDAVGRLAEIDGEYPVLTLHDAVFVPESRSEEALEVFRSVYTDAYGVSPQIKIDSSDAASDDSEWLEVTEEKRSCEEFEAVVLPPDLGGSFYNFFTC